jgi:hypothetical protein
MVHTLICNSDTGSRDLGSEFRFVRETPENVVRAKAIELATKKLSPVVMIIRLSPYRSKPGGWYIKGYSGRFTYDDLRARIQTNLDAGKFTRHECWLIRLCTK